MIIVGLGNPGEQYVNTKHNAGYWVLDRLANEFNLKFKLGKGEYMHTKSADISLVKPIGYMNNSGIALKHYMDYFLQEQLQDLWQAIFLLRRPI